MDLIKNVPNEDAKHNTRKQIIIWWEKKRLYYNLIMLTTGVPLLIIALTKIKAALSPSDSSLIIIYGVFANILYSSGSVLEILILKNIKNRKITRIGQLLFITGTVISVLINFYAFSQLCIF
ncbi:MAG: hypothetical protein WC614_02500 [bacterium]